MSAKKKSQKEVSTPAQTQRDDQEFEVSLPEASRFTGSSVTTLKRHANDGIIDFVTKGYGSKPRYYFRLRDLETYKKNAVRKGKKELTLVSSEDVDRQTNPAVHEAIEQRPEIFKGWSEEKKNRIFGQFGKGGALTVDGAIELAIEENATDEIRRKFEIVIRNKNHRASLESIINTMYQSTSLTRRR